jgi:hypothetical protein
LEIHGLSTRLWRFNWLNTEWIIMKQKWWWQGS